MRDAGNSVSKANRRSHAEIPALGGIALGFVLFLVAIASGLVYAMMRHFYPSPPQAIYNKPKDQRINRSLNRNQPYYPI